MYFCRTTFTDGCVYRVCHKLSTFKMCNSCNNTHWLSMCYNVVYFLWTNAGILILSQLNILCTSSVTLYYTKTTIKHRTCLLAIYLISNLLDFTEVELYIKTFSTVMSGERNGFLNFTTVTYSALC